MAELVNCGKPAWAVKITPKRNAVIVDYFDGARVVSIECKDRRMQPLLENEARRILAIIKPED